MHSHSHTHTHSSWNNCWLVPSGILMSTDNRNMCRDTDKSLPLSTRLCGQLIKAPNISFDGKVSMVLVRLHWQWKGKKDEQRQVMQVSIDFQTFHRPLKLSTISHIPKQSFNIAHTLLHIAWQNCRLHSFVLPLWVFVLSFVVPNRLWFLNGPHTHTHTHS